MSSMSLGSPGGMVSKQEDSDGGDKSDKRDSKPTIKALNRVSRACNACRKQKMRCEGAENPPCRRCRHAGLECLFEKPSREASLTGEAGLERIRSLESHVADIRASQTTVQNTLNEILAHLRRGASYERSPASSYGQTYTTQSPNPNVATPTQMAPQLAVDTSRQQSQQPSSNYSIQSIVSPTNQSHDYRSPRMAQAQATANGRSLAAAGQQYAGYSQGQTSRQPLPSMTSVASGSSGSHQYGRSSNPHSADTSDMDDEDTGELPASGLIAPWEVLRGLASVAIERAAYEQIGSAPPSRPHTPNPPTRPNKRRRTMSKTAIAPTFPDVVTKQIIPEAEARELFRIFYHGCSTFLSVFDPAVDTYDSLHERSPFALDCICMVGAQVRDGGGKPSDTYNELLKEVQMISQATLFAPVTRAEAVQAMILVAGWSENGWLPGGHAVRMALELGMHTAWPRLMTRMQAKKASTGPEDRELVVAARTWFCAYVFEHQCATVPFSYNLPRLTSLSRISYGTGRPAILKDDESIWQCRLLLQHPLSTEDDMRLVSTVELMAVRERVNNNLSPLDRPIDDHTFNVLRSADHEFQTWYRNWDQAFSQKYEDAAFYRQSLTIQHMHAELFHNSNALRDINSAEDVQRMPPMQRELAIHSIRIALKSLEITVNSPAYREGMKYAVHYTHVTATFTASLLLRLARLFPEECDMQRARGHVENLAQLMMEIPAKRYALTLKLMIKSSKRRLHSRSPSSTRDLRNAQASGADPAMLARQAMEAYSPTFYANTGEMQQGQVAPQGMANQYVTDAAHNIDQIWRRFEMTSTEQLPVWLQDQTMGGNSITQHGMNAFLVPQDYFPTPAHIW